ncbi:hypothetical protein ACHWQZ_G003323 [Mnemiopsis leidyi]
MLTPAFLIMLLRVLHCEEECQIRELDAPIAAQDGDFIIGGLFQVGEVQYTSSENRTVAPHRICSYENSKEWNVQKAIVLRALIDKENKRFKRDFNKTLGYEMYDTCKDSAVTTRVSDNLAQRDDVIGISGVDMKEYLKRSASITASFHIPTFVYMFNDEELMRAEEYPTVFSMIDTEVNEAEITIRFLEKLGYKYMDIWYHKFSREMAEHIYKSYLVKAGGCGRIADVTYQSHLHRINETYNETGGDPSQVQLILQNSATTTRAILEEMLGNLKFQNKIYILGLSNGRLSYLDGYTDIFKKFNNSGNSTIILPLPDPLNTKLPKTVQELNKDWRTVEKRDYIDDIYQNVQSRRCSKDNENPKNCSLTSWIPHMVGGVKLIFESLHASLKKRIPLNRDCYMDYKTELFDEILNENRTLSVSLEENVTMPVRITNKTLNTGYTIGVFRTETNTYDTLGRAFISHIEVSNPKLLTKIRSGYNKTCSHTCRPGTHRRFTDTIQFLPCCWTCEPCKIHKYSVKNNSHSCESCHELLAATENHTACILLPEIFIGPDTPVFIAAACCIPLGIGLVVAIGVIIHKHEDRSVIQDSEPGYLYMTLLSLLAGYLAAFLPLLKPSSNNCLVEYYTFVVVVTLISVNLLHKCAKLYEFFSNENDLEKPELCKLLERVGQTALNLGALVITVTVVTIDNVTGGGPTWTFDRYQSKPHSSRILMCTSAGGRGLVLIFPLIIPGFSLVSALFLAFKMRRFPYNYRESLNIFCAIFVVLLCFAMFVAGYAFSPPVVQPILRTIILFLSSTTFIFCIYLPKLIVVFDKKSKIEDRKTRLMDKLKKFSASLSLDKVASPRIRRGIQVVPTCPDIMIDPC